MGFLYRMRRTALYAQKAAGLTERSQPLEAARGWLHTVKRSRLHGRAQDGKGVYLPRTDRSSNSGSGGFAAVPPAIALVTACAAAHAVACAGRCVHHRRRLRKCVDLVGIRGGFFAAHKGRSHRLCWADLAQRRSRIESRRVASRAPRILRLVVRRRMVPSAPCCTRYIRTYTAAAQAQRERDILREDCAARPIRHGRCRRGRHGSVLRNVREPCAVTRIIPRLLLRAAWCPH